MTDKISALVLVRPYNWRWFLGLGIGFALTMLLLLAITVLLFHGVGVWGVDVPVMWGFAIVNFVWWIGIGHAGTLDLGDPPACSSRTGGPRSTGSPRR